MNLIDRIDDRGDIREHIVSEKDPKRTLCGLDLFNTQNACGNRACGRCKVIAAMRDAKTAKVRL